MSMGFISETIDKIKYNHELDRITEGDEEGRSIVKGKDFEKTVYNLFPRFEFDLFDKNADDFDSDIKGSFVQSRGPFDFGFTHKKSGQKFYVECKYRSSFYFDKNKNITYYSLQKTRNNLKNTKNTAWKIMSKSS